MFPYLLDLGTADLPLLGEVRLILPTYGFLFAVGTLLAWTWFLRRARSLDVDADVAFNLSFFGLLAGLVGAKVALLLVEWRHYLAHPADILASVRSAGVLMGGVAVGALTFVVYARRHRLPLLRLGDAIAAPLALAQGVGRLGCLAAGCCFGRPVSPSAWYGLVFTRPEAAEQTGVSLGVPLFPTQPLEAAGDLVLAALLTWMWRRPTPPGTVFGAYLVLYGAGRAAIETARGDLVRGLWFGGAVSTSQALSAIAVLAGLGLLVRGWRAR